VSNSSLISIQNVEKHFHTKKVLNGVTLDIATGELTAIIGPSGCGKSTLLRCLNGLETVNSGRVVIDGITLESPEHLGKRELDRRTLTVRQSVGMVFQSFNLFPHMTVLENVAKAPQVVKKVARSEAEDKAAKLLGKVGLDQHLHHYPHQLSGGQQQRASIARALAMEPKILLYDEPTSALDPSLVNEVLQVMKQLDQEGMTQLVVTHEMRFARDASDKIVFLEGGHVVEVGAAEQIFSAPRDERTKKFLRHFT
jgi:polar amino acid transport system ATP-binding protein